MTPRAPTPSARPEGPGTSGPAAIAAIIGTLVGLAAGVEAVPQTAVTSSPSAVTRVRGLDGRVRALLDDGRERSPTFRRLCDTLERSDLVVVVDVRPLKAPAQTSFVAATPAGRVVRITLSSIPQVDDVLLALLAHELQHAVEIAAAPQVVNSASMLGLYGEPGGCTLEAQKVKYIVAYELGMSPKPQPRRRMVVTNRGVLAQLSQAAARESRNKWR